MTNQLSTTKLFGVSVTSASQEDILKYVDELLQHSSEKCYIVTPNPEMIVRASKDEQIKTVLNSAAISLVDGVGLVWAAKFLGKGKLERFSGTDFVSAVCMRYAEKPVNIGFLGGKKDIAEKAADCLMEKYPGLKVVFASEEWGEQGFKFEKKGSTGSTGSDSGIVEETKTTRQTPIGKNELPHIDILFVAFGFPKQELWIAEHLPNLPVTIAVGVGGALDYLSGAVPRAPGWAQAAGLEWLFRLIRQPWRWKRQLALLEFMGLVIGEKLHRKEA